MNQQAKRLGPGKAPPELLAVALGDLSSADLIQGPGVGRDAAIIRRGDEAIVATADPITFVDADAGRLAVTVNANDICAVGADPRWLLATILAPVDVEAAELESLLVDLRRACDEAGIELVGGHTEVTDAVTRTVVSSTMIGSAPLATIIRSDGAQDGDLVIQAGRAAVEGTAILGHPELLDDPGISIAVAARALRSIDGIHAMHDVTEGGIATASLELAEAAGLGVELFADDILWLPQTLEECESRDLDPLGLLGSGTLLAAVSPDAADAAMAALAATGVASYLIGRMESGLPATLRFGGRKRPLPRFVRDEALRALDDARRSHQQVRSDVALSRSSEDDPDSGGDEQETM